MLSATASASSAALLASGACSPGASSVLSHPMPILASPVLPHAHSMRHAHSPFPLFASQPLSAFHSPQLHPRTEPTLLASPLLLPQAHLPHLSDFPSLSQQDSSPLLNTRKIQVATGMGVQATLTSFAHPQGGAAGGQGGAFPTTALPHLPPVHRFDVNMMPFSTNYSSFHDLGDFRQGAPELSLLDRLQRSHSGSPASMTAVAPTAVHHKKQPVPGIVKPYPGTAQVASTHTVLSAMQALPDGHASESDSTINQTPHKAAAAPSSSSPSGNLSQLRANVPPALSVRADHQVIPVPDSAFSYDPWSDDSHGCGTGRDSVCAVLPLTPTTPVPVGRVWASLDRYPALQSKCVAHLGQVSEARYELVNALRHRCSSSSAMAQARGGPGVGSALAPRATAMIDQLSARFDQLHVHIVQRFLKCAERQAALDDLTAARTGQHAPQPFSFDLAPIAPLAPLVAPTACAPVAVAKLEVSAQHLDAEADAEVASMVDHHAPQRQVSVKAEMAASHFVMPLRQLSDGSAPPPLLPHTPHSRSITSGSDASASSGSTIGTQRLSAVPEHRASASHSPSALLSLDTQHLLRSERVAAEEFSASPSPPSDARRRREEIHSNPTLTLKEKVKLLLREDSGAVGGDTLAEGNEDMPSASSQPSMMRSQSVQQRSSPSCRRQLNFDALAPLRPASSLSARQSPYLAKLALNVPLEVWLLNHLDDPYPTSQEKSALSKKSGLSYDQISHWFINARLRAVKPAMDELAREQQQTLQSGGSRKPTPVPSTSPFAAATAAAAAHMHPQHESSTPKKMKREHSDEGQLANWADATHEVASPSDRITPDSLPQLSAKHESVPQVKLEPSQPAHTHKQPSRTTKRSRR